MLFRIKTVDMFGHLGRDNHPQESDVGLIVAPLKLDTRFFGDTSDGTIAGVDGINQGALPYLFGDKEDDAHFVEECYTCVTKDGRLLDLMDFELEPITPTEQDIFQRGSQRGLAERNRP